MKKKWNSILRGTLIMLSVFSMTILISCSNNNGPGTFEGLSKKMEERIEKDYYKWFIHPKGDKDHDLKYKDIQICKYFGTFGEKYIVVSVDGDYSTHIGRMPYWCYRLDGKSKFADSYRYPMAWDNGKFYEFIDAYELGFLIFEETLYIFENIILYECPEDSLSCNNSQGSCQVNEG